jgi:PAS domain S-box-containing protein
MNETSFLGLAQNIALLLALVVIFDIVSFRWNKSQPTLGKIITGISIGAIGITIMLTPWVFIPGLVYDTRSVLLGISGLFFGPIPTFIAMAMTIIFRLSQGGIGAGVGVSVILASGLIGILWRYFRKKPLEFIPWWEVYLFGVIIHVVMLALMLTLPWDTAQQVLASISLQVMIIYPLGTTLVGAILTNRIKGEILKENLHRSETRLNSTQHLTKAGGWEWDVKKQEMYWSDEVYSIHGFFPGDIPPGSAEHIQKSLDCYDAKDRETISTAFRNCVEKGEPYILELPFTTYQGQKLWIRTSAEPVIEKNKVVRVIGNLLDITAQKQAEQTLRDRETYIQTILDNLPIGIAVNSVEPTVEFTYMNDNFPKFYRTTREKLAEPDVFWNVVYEDPEFREKIKQRVMEDTASNDPERMVWEDVPITRRGEETTYITARNIPLRDKSFMISTVWDTTERKRAEEALKQKGFLQEKMASLGRQLTSTLDLQSIYQTTAHYLKELTDCPIIDITLFDPKQQTLKPAFYEVDGVSRDVSDLPTQQYQPTPSTGGRSITIATKKPLIIRDFFEQRTVTTGMLVLGEQKTTICDLCTYDCGWAGCWIT